MQSVILGAIDRYSRNHNLNAELAEAITHYKIKNVPEFLGQVFVESQYLSVLSENLNYSVDALTRAYYPRRITMQVARSCGRAPGQTANQQGIANAIYGGPWGLKNLGNSQPNDGWHFRGQGPIQLTGRDNITRFAQWYGDLLIITDPTRISRIPKICVASACWYWAHNSRCNQLANDVSACTRGVTGSATHAYERRLSMTMMFRKLIK